MSTHLCCKAPATGLSNNPSATQLAATQPSATQPSATKPVGHISQPPSLARRAKGYISGALPGIMLILMPKCPACLAAYISVGTGIGISFTTAKYLRVSLIILCLATLLYAVAKRQYLFRSR
jgi:hypothetical protein